MLDKAPIPTAMQAIIMLVLIAIIMGIGSFTLYKAYEAGKDSGYLSAQVKYQPLLDACNQERTARNQRIATLEDDANQMSKRLTELEAAEPAVVEKIITEYKTKYKEVAGSCGVSKDTADAFNTIIRGLK